MSNLFSKLGQISSRAEVGGSQKAGCAESCSNSLSFVPKLRCFPKKKERSLSIFLLWFFKFYPEIQMVSKKKVYS